MAQYGGSAPIPAGEIGGPTALEGFRSQLNRSFAKRKQDEIEGGGPLNIEDEGVKRKITRDEPVEKEEEYDVTYKRIGNTYCKAHTTLSNLAEGKLVLKPQPMQNGFFNPSEVYLQLKVRFTRMGVAADADGTHFFRHPRLAGRSYADAGNNANTMHIRPCFLPGPAMLAKVMVKSAGNNGMDLNETNEFEYAKNVMEYMVKLTPAEKQDQETKWAYFAEPEFFGPYGTALGRIRTRALSPNNQTNITSLHAEFPAEMVPVRLMEEFFADQHGEDGYIFQIGPLKGPFFRINRFMPGGVEFEYEIQVETDLHKWLLTRRSSATGLGAVATEEPALEIIEANTRLVIPWVEMNKAEREAEENDFYGALNIPVTVEKETQFWASSTFNVIDNQNGLATDVPKIDELDGNIPEQFLIGFMTDAVLRGGVPAAEAYLQEKINFGQNGIQRFQIYINDAPLFTEPVYWNNSHKNLYQLWKNQKGIMGRRGNPDRKHFLNNAEYRYLDNGMKFLHVTLNPNYDGLTHHGIDQLDATLSIRVWGEDAVNNVRCCIMTLDWRQFIVKEPVNNYWVPAQKMIKPSIHKENYKCFNVEGGLMLLEQ